MITFKLADNDAAFVVSKLLSLDPAPAFVLDLQIQLNTQQTAANTPAPAQKMEKVTTTTTTVVEEVIPTPAA